MRSSLATHFGPRSHAVGGSRRPHTGGTSLAFWWLDSSTVYALGLVLIAAVYIGFAVADGRPKVIAVESGVTFAFVVVAAAAVTESPWLLVAGLFGHGLKDLWQHRTQFVARTRWCPPSAWLSTGSSPRSP